MNKVANHIFNEHTEIKMEVTEVFEAAILGNATQMLALLRIKGMESRTNLLDSYHRTPLFWASTRGHNDVVEVLLAQTDILLNVQKSGNGGQEAHKVRNELTATPSAVPVARPDVLT